MKWSRVFIVLFFGAVMVLTIFGFVVRTWRPPVASEHGAGVDFVINYLLITTGAVFVIGHVVLAWLVWRHTGAEQAAYRPVSRRTELLWALLPVMFFAVVSEAGVLVIGRPVWEQLYGELPDDALQVEVVGKQFEWIVRYPGKDGKFGRTDPEAVHETRNRVGLVDEDPAAKDDIISSVLYLPVNRAVRVQIRSHDVLHSFTVPSFRMKQDAVPGYPTHTQFKPTEVGEYEIACAELCGMGHYEMSGRVVVYSAEAFRAWLDKQIGWFE